MNTTKVEHGEEQFEDDTVVLDNVWCFAMSKGAVEQVEETEDRLKIVSRKVSDRNCSSSRDRDSQHERSRREKRGVG